jgi:hypothetical protein
VGGARTDALDDPDDLETTPADDIDDEAEVTASAGSDV